MMHCYLLGIYYLRQDMESAKKHAKAVVQIAFENKHYFPLITFYYYFAPILSSVLAQYPDEFQNHCHKLISQYEENFPAFLVSMNEDSVTAKLADTDYPIIYGVLHDLSYSSIASELGVHPHTVRYRLEKMCKKFGVLNKNELKDYLLNYL